MEYRDLYDNNRILTGEKILKNDKIPDNKFILMVVIFIQNDKNEFLIQKRTLDKDGLWATTGGIQKVANLQLKEL